MELSYFLAQLFGLTLIVFSFIWWLRPKVVDGAIDNLRQQPFSMLLAGFIGIVAGLAMILSHNVWEFSWVGVITLFGWSALVKGITYIAFPDLLLATADSFLRQGRRQVAATLAFLLGLYLAYNGFAIGW